MFFFSISRIAEPFIVFYWNVQLRDIRRAVHICTKWKTNEFTVFWKRESITWKENLKSNNCARIRFFVPLNHMLNVVAIKLLVVSLWDLRRYDIVYLTTADSPTFVQVFSIVVLKIVSTVLGFFAHSCLFAPVWWPVKFGVSDSFFNPSFSILGLLLYLLVVSR